MSQAPDAPDGTIGTDAAALADMLAFLAEAGEDMAIADAPRAWLDAPPAHESGEIAATGPSLRRESPAPAVRIARVSSQPVPGGSVDIVEEIARQAAAQALTLDALRALMESFEGCALRNTATQLVFADGNPQARLMLVGEAPGAEEDRSGKPFVGQAGQLLDRMLAAVGLDRTQVYIANVVPWRPPGNRTPTPQETAVCRPFIERQIALVDPRILVCLGGSATQSLLGLREGITRVRGRWVDYAGARGPIQTMATLHPAYLLRQPIHKRLVWQDLRAIRQALDQVRDQVRDPAPDAGEP